MMASWCHGKSGKQIERCVMATFRIAESLGFKGDLSPVGGLVAEHDFSTPEHFFNCFNSRK
jgi:hypothetical protein